MDDSTFVIVGANGQLGMELRKRYPRARAADSAQLDITDKTAVQNFDWQNVTVILNAASYTNVDGAETVEGRKAAWKVNAVGVANLARAAMEHSAVLIHISSDYVYDGAHSPHSEDEPFTPLGVYAQSKAAGDIAASVYVKTYIIRTSWVVGEGNNFVRTMIGLAEKNICPTVVADQIGRLTFTPTIVDAIDHLLQQQAPFGTYNVSGSGEPASWAAVTRAIFDELGRSDLTVTDTTTTEYFASKPSSAPRPLQSTLDLTKITGAGVQPADWRQGLQAYVAAYQNNQITAKE